MSATSLGVAQSGECLRREGLVWLIGAVMYLLAATPGPMSVSAGNWMAAFALQHYWLLAINCHFQDCKARCSCSLPLK